MNAQTQQYFRRDQADGVTPPDLTRDCSYAEHIVRARGKRTQFTSVSLDPDAIRDFGPALYRVLRPEIDQDGHAIVSHSDLLQRLREAAASTTKEERARALQAQRYAKRRKEGLVAWTFSLQGIERKALITWAIRAVQKYFSRI